MKGKENMYPRYTLIRESYKDADGARKRGLRLRDFDPKIDAKTKQHAGLVLRQGFVSNRDVIIVTTDAVIFSHRDLNDLADDLELLNKK